MRFSDSMKEKVKKEVNAVSWPRIFYDEMDAAERMEMLEEAIQRELDPENDRARKQIVVARYGKNEKSGVMPDRYMQLVLECIYLANQKRGSSKSMKKIMKMMEDLGMTAAASGDSAMQEALKAEIRHAVRLYIAICRQDRHYSSIVFGLGHMSEESLTAKIRGDIDKIAHCVDEAGDESGAAKIWRETALAASEQMLPR